MDKLDELEARPGYATRNMPRQGMKSIFKRPGIASIRALLSSASRLENLPVRSVLVQPSKQFMINLTISC